jgi:hypothetical protein
MTALRILALTVLCFVGAAIGGILGLQYEDYAAHRDASHVQHQGGGMYGG